MTEPTSSTSPAAPRAVRYLDPKIDLAFKRLFGQHIDLLKSFLNALLPLPEDAPIVELEYLSAEQVPDLPLLKKHSIVDVKCQDAQGRIFIVEMQMLWTAYFGQRVLFGGSQAYVRQLDAGQDYSLLQPVYALAVVNSIFEPNSPDYYHHYKIIKVGEPAKVLEGLEFVFIELPKFKPESPGHNRMARLWLKFLSEIGRNTEQTPDPQLSEQPEIAKALHLMEFSALSEPDRQAYERSLDAWRTESTLLKGKREEGLQEGFAMGMEKGMVAGENKRTLEIAKAMKTKGLETAAIAELTGLNSTTIEAL